MLNSPTSFVPLSSNNVKDSRWLTLEVCREYQRNKCTRTENDCKFAHPPAHVEVQNGRVICCYDSIKGKCQRRDPPCKYLHPPQHLREQLLQNGRNNLILKNIQVQLLQQSLFPQNGQLVTMPSAAYDVINQSKNLYSPTAVSPGPAYSMLNLLLSLSKQEYNRSQQMVTPTKMCGATHPLLTSYLSPATGGHLQPTNGTSPSPGAAAGPYPNHGGVPPGTLFSVLSPVAAAGSEGLLATSASPSNAYTSNGNVGGAASGPSGMPNGGQSGYGAASGPHPGLHVVTCNGGGGAACPSQMSIANSISISQNKALNLAAYSAMLSAAKQRGGAGGLCSMDHGDPLSGKLNNGMGGGRSALYPVDGGSLQTLMYQNPQAAVAALSSMQLPPHHQHHHAFLHHPGPPNSYHIEIPQFGFH